MAKELSLPEGVIKCLRLKTVGASY